MHLGEEVDFTVADSPDEAPTISEATVPESVLDTLEADLTPPVPSTVPASADVATTQLSTMPTSTAILSASTAPASSRVLRTDHSARCREFQRF